MENKKTNDFDQNDYVQTCIQTCQKNSHTKLFSPHYGIQFFSFEIRHGIENHKIYIPHITITIFIKLFAPGVIY